MALSDKLQAEFTELVTHYPEKRAGLIPALHRCQEEQGGWLSPQAIEDLAEFFGLEPVEVFGVATFYPMFRLTPRGRHLVSVCHNISCTLRGAEDLLAHVCHVTGSPVGGTSPDGKLAWCASSAKAPARTRRCSTSTEPTTRTSTPRRPSRS